MTLNAREKESEGEGDSGRIRANEQMYANERIKSEWTRISANDHECGGMTAISRDSPAKVKMTSRSASLL